MAKTNYHVMKHPNGGWQGKKEGSQKATFITPTKAEAEKKAKEIVGNQGGGEVKLHGVKGNIIDSDTVKPGNDPNPPKDKKF